jgi:acetaldehyde dehydrogenase (acetylating)
MTLGCGGWGGNITSDNISPRHLINIKRLAYETNPAGVTARGPATGHQGSGTGDRGPGTGQPPEAALLPRPPAAPPLPGGIAADVLARRIDDFLSSRGYRGIASSPIGGTGAATTDGAEGATGGAASEQPADFVCEDDVRQALKQNRKIVIGEKTIVTPAARDLGEEHRAFVQAQWRG